MNDRTIQPAPIVADQAVGVKHAPDLAEPSFSDTVAASLLRPVRPSNRS